VYSSVIIVDTLQQAKESFVTC